MDRYIEKKAEEVKKILEEITPEGEKKIKDCFSYFLNNKKEMKFIDYYKKTVLEKDKINFVNFRNQWGLQRANKDFYVNFNKVFGKEYDKGISEIREKKDIVGFYVTYCMPEGENVQGSFCSKLFHTIFPEEFPPVDRNLRNTFKLQNESFILAILIIKKGYKEYIQDNENKFKHIRDVLPNEKFNELKINKISNIRIIDMFCRFYARNQINKKKSRDEGKPH